MSRWVDLDGAGVIKMGRDKYGNVIYHIPPDLPIADVVERKKGKWNCGDDMFEYALCSACKWDSGEAWEYAKKYFRYCPNCGAEMRQDDPSHPFADDVMMKGETE